MSEHTPTTDQIRNWWIFGDGHDDESWDASALSAAHKSHAAGFDRWLAAHDAEVRADEREQAAHRVGALEPFPVEPCDGLLFAKDAVAAARGGGWARCGCGPTKCEMHAKARAEVARIYAERRDEQA